MKPKFYQYLLMLLLAYACSKETPTPTSNSTVYLAGRIDTAACYWKNGKYFPLGGNSSGATSMAVCDSTVWISGFDFSVDNSDVIWKNRVESVPYSYGGIFLTAQGTDIYSTYFSIAQQQWLYTKNGLPNVIGNNNADTTWFTFLTGISVHGNDVYVCGNRWIPPQYYAECWKNGKLIYRESRNTEALGIYADQNDVYMCGVLHPDSSSTRACYWKNSEMTLLTNGSHDKATSVFVSGADLFVAGSKDTQAVYWKNSVAVVLGSDQSNANSIFVHGSDVHVGGDEYGQPAYWKNNIKQWIDLGKSGTIKSVVVQ